MKMEWVLEKCKLNKQYFNVICCNLHTVEMSLLFTWMLWFLSFISLTNDWSQIKIASINNKLLVIIIKWNGMEEEDTYAGKKEDIQPWTLRAKSFRIFALRLHKKLKFTWRQHKDGSLKLKKTNWNLHFIRILSAKQIVKCNFIIVQEYVQMYNNNSHFSSLCLNTTIGSTSTILVLNSITKVPIIPTMHAMK